MQIEQTRSLETPLRLKRPGATRPVPGIAPILEIHLTGGRPGFPNHGTIRPEVGGGIGRARCDIRGPIEGHEQPPGIFVTALLRRHPIPRFPPGSLPIHLDRGLRPPRHQPIGRKYRGRRAEPCATVFHGPAYPSVNAFRKTMMSSISSSDSAGSSPGFRSSGGSWSTLSGYAGGKSSNL